MGELDEIRSTQLAPASSEATCYLRRRAMRGSRTIAKSRNAL